MFPRTEMLDLVVVDGHAKGIVVRDMVTGEISSHAADTVLPRDRAVTATPSTSPPTRWAATSPRPTARTSAAPTSPIPCYTQIQTRPASRSAGSYQSKLTLMSESLRNDGRVWVPKRRRGLRTRIRTLIPDEDSRLLPRAQIPILRQPRTTRHLVARRQRSL